METQNHVVCRERQYHQVLVYRMTYINPYLIFNAMRNVIRIAVWPDFDKFTENSLFSFLSLFANSSSSYLRFLIFLKITIILKTVNNFKRRRDGMQSIKYVSVLLFL